MVVYYVEALCPGGLMSDWAFVHILELVCQEDLCLSPWLLLLLNFAPNLQYHQENPCYTLPKPASDQV